MKELLSQNKYTPEMYEYCRREIIGKGRKIKDVSTDFPQISLQAFRRYTWRVGLLARSPRRTQELTTIHVTLLKEDRDILKAKSEKKGEEYSKVVRRLIKLYNEDKI